ncbi:ABC1 kinase family protein [Leptospira sp. GIMC2001]|uniref:ABC1 kinase family protein n=1 Tax=Leptospira sp. GIMC2001 TaxID=1513297 RepID=UPI00234ADFB1|nr:AarF/UbiB family protein [Leptospira sp. GIMC2001]WCL47990.1 AarF/UbiB family protein [Leptospira sp. GIMC2001]
MQLSQSNKRSGGSRILSAYSFIIRKAISFFILHRIQRKFIEESEFQKLNKLAWSNTGLETKKLFLNLGGIYIKLGQFFSNSAHILPEEFILPLQDLQDRVPSHEYKEIEKRFQMEFGKSPIDLFENFSEIPIASASTAQVHKARYKNRDVAVKVLYPDIEKLVNSDLKTIFKIMKWFNIFLIAFPYKEMHAQLTELIIQEMDLSCERKNIIRMRELFSSEEDIIIPEPIMDFQSSKILVTEFIDGCKLSEHAPNPNQNAQKSKPIEILIKSYILMVFQFRFFHADPHPGNLLVTPDGKLCLIDFGAVGNISETQKTALEKILVSAMNRNYYGVLDGIEMMGILKSSTDRSKILEIIKYSLEKMKSFLADTDFYRNISLDKFNIQADIQFLRGIQTSLSDLIRELNLPSNYISLQRVLSLLVGNIAILDPYRSIFEYTEKPFMIFVAKTNPWKQKLGADYQEILSSMFAIPKEIYTYLYKKNRDSKPNSAEMLEKLSIRSYILGHQYIYSALFMFSSYIGFHLLDRNNENFARLAFLTAGLFASILIVSFFKNRIKR